MSEESFKLVKDSLSKQSHAAFQDTTLVMLSNKSNNEY